MDTNEFLNRDPTTGTHSPPLLAKGVFRLSKAELRSSGALYDGAIIVPFYNSERQYLRY